MLTAAEDNKENKDSVESKMEIVFIAGPYFRDGTYKAIEENIREAEKYQIALANLEIGHFCAHNHTEHFEEKALAPESFYRKQDFRFLKMADAVLAIPEWETSKGATEEITFAQKTGKPVFFPKSPENLEDLKNWVYEWRKNHL